jgi:hypothetical protein
LATTTKVVDAGGEYDGKVYEATATVTDERNTITSPAPTIVYFDTSSGTPIPLPGAPANAGNYRAIAFFPGDDDHLASNASVDFVITKATPMVGVTAPGGVQNGQPFEATGGVFGVDSANLGTPTFTYFQASDTAMANPLADAPSGPGNYVVVGSYPGDVNYQAASDQVSFTIKALTSVTVTDAGGVYTGNPFPATVTVMSNGLPITTPEPRVSYFDLDGGVFALDGPPAAAGRYRAIAVYDGDELHAPSSNSVDFTIAKATPTISMLVPQGALNGRPAQATGTVFGVNEAVLGTPRFVYLTATDNPFALPVILSGPPSTAGNYEVIAIYDGGPNYDAVSVKEFFTITTP